MSIKDFSKRDKAAHHEDIGAGLSNYEKKPFPLFSRVKTCKRGTKVSVLLSTHLMNALRLLVGRSEVCGVLDDNPFLFARPGSLAAYRGQECIRNLWCTRP